MNSVYMIKFLWSTDDDSGCEIELYKNYDRAVKRFNEMTENEKDPDFSWAADAFDDRKFDDENYELNYYTGTDYLYWSVNKRDYSNFYTQAYIFHTGIYNDIDSKYGIDVLLEYTALVHECYLSDSNRTPLGELCDYVAENWIEIKDMSRYEILDKFYTEIGL